MTAAAIQDEQETIILDAIDRFLDRDVKPFVMELEHNDTYPEEIVSGKIRGRLSHRAGPWKLSGDWWEREKRWTRQEWDIQLEDGSLYRIACCGETPEEKEWFLEGVYG